MDPSLFKGVGVDPGRLQDALNELFEEGHPELHTLASSPEYKADVLAEEDFALTVHSMGTSLSDWVRAVFERKLFADAAQVIGLTSEGNEIAMRGYAAVSAAKAALEAVSRSIAREYAAFGIRANVIQAGVTDTPALRLIPGNAHMRAAARLRNPCGRLTRPEDVAGFVMLLCLPESDWLNGNIIRVDGGEHISG